MKNKHEEAIEVFKRMSKGYMARLAVSARKYMRENPGAADHAGFWKPRGFDGNGLSARQVASIEFGLRKGY